MKNALIIIKELWNNMNRFSKNLLKFGVICGVLFYTAAFIVFLCAGRSGDYYTLMRWFQDITECGKETLSVTLVPALLIDVLHKAEKIKEQ